MKIKSIRYGHANNSSSSHSIVFLGDVEVDDTVNGDNEFGWNFFTASSRKSKESYLLITLYYNIGRGYFNKVFVRQPIVEKVFEEDDNRYSRYSDDSPFQSEKSEQYEEKNSTASNKYQIQLIREHFGDIFKEIDLKEELEPELQGYVDHQSIISLPKDKYGQIHFKFVKELFKTLLDNNFVILGGNDNSDGEHMYQKLHKKTKLSDKVAFILNIVGSDGPSSEIVMYDEKNNDYIFQSKTTGHKTRINFDNKSKKTKKSGFPELLDIKITNQCHYGCRFCYQSSISEGKHASYDYIKQVIDASFNSNVMEIAIGGGEPTIHPNLLNIINYIRSKSMMVGFTTKNFDLLKLPNIKNILSNTHSIAISCSSLKEVEKVVNINAEILQNRDKYLTGWYDRPEFYVQLIPELLPDDKFKEIIKYCSEQRLKVTLLGYKEFGFGKTYNPKNLNMSDNWIDVIKAEKINVGIDSVMVKKWKDKLIEKGCDKLMLVGEEGKFSCYIDAVNKKIASSSFVDEQQYLDFSTGDFLKQFSEF